MSDASSKALQIWKRLVAEWFDEVKIDVDVNDYWVMMMIGMLEECVTLVCCVSALYRLERSESSTRKNVDDTVDCIISTNW